jgi:hypothetical protein
MGIFRTSKLRNEKEIENDIITVGKLLLRKEKPTSYSLNKKIEKLRELSNELKKIGH